jgi:hypothetical protein
MFLSLLREKVADITMRHILFTVRTLLKLGGYSSVTVLVSDLAVRELNTHRHTPKDLNLRPCWE